MGERLPTTTNECYLLRSNAEYCPNGSLYELLRRPDAQARLTWRTRVGMAVDAARGVLYLHSRQPAIIHRDLKSPNLLVDAAWQVKVCGRQLLSSPCVLHY
jgi:serine/threonine protein kinase